MAASSTHLKWALKKATGKEHVSFGNFVRHFNLADQESASDAFTLLISSNQISRDRREKLQKNFREFCDHHAERFWAERNAKISSEVTAKQAGVISQRVGLKQSEIEYRQYFSSTTGLGLPQSAATTPFPGSLKLGAQSTVDDVSTATTNKTTGVRGWKDEPSTPFTSQNFSDVPEDAALPSVPSKRSAQDVISQVEDADVNAPSRKPLHKRVTILEVEFLSESGSDYVDSKPSSARSSLNSIDFVLIDHLVGPGTTSSQLTTNDRLVMDQVDVSQALMDARRSLIMKQSELKDASDLLTLNFVFDATFLKKHILKDGPTSLLFVSIPIVSDKEKRFLFDCSEFVASHSFLDSKKHVRNKIQTEGESLVADLLRHYTERSNLWQHCTSYPMPSSLLAQNEDTYTQAIVKGIIFGVVGDLELLDHWSRDPLPTPTGFEEVYNPDYFGEYDGFPVMIVEIKKPGAMDDNIEGDQRRLPCMQKLMLDRMLSAGVKDPKVVGFLIRRSRCEITIMSLDYEALYIVKTVGVFELPQNNLQLGLLCPALGPLKFVHEAVSRILNAVKTRSSKHSMRGSWRRPSYYVKGNQIPPPRSSIEDVEDLLISKTQQKNQEKE